MAIQDDNTLVTKGDLKALYSDKIAPYLGANLAIRTNVSDYYSEDEKIVGVWINGKPLYQKSFLMTYPEQTVEHNVVDVYLDTGVSIDEVIDVRGTRHSGSEAWTTNIHNSLMAFDAPSSSSHLYPYVIDGGIVYVYSNAAPDTTRKNKIRLATSQNLEGQTTYITLQYTKTTDTASSALTTPGCYDINFPNTWPNGSEIYFGNGLYGLRKQGTATVSELRPGLVLVEGVSTSAVCWSKGGMIDMSKTAGTNWYDINGVWDKSSPYRPLVTNTDGRFKFYCLQCEGYSDSTSLQYNIWITYTK